MLTENTITFGKYTGKDIKEVLKDRNYCQWLLKQDWFQKNYPGLWDKINNYNPLKQFLRDSEPEQGEFVLDYTFFNLKSPIEITLSRDDMTCYAFYYDEIMKLKTKLINNFNDSMYDNPYDIKAPTRWLQNFEKDTGIHRDKLKEFLKQNELPNITKVIEDIKGAGGLSYKGHKSYLIAKERSVKQENYWHDILKSKYGLQIGTQFKYKNCFFDFVNIENKIIYECKLDFKDFNDEQYQKYLAVLEEFKVIYLIGNETLVDMKSGIVYTSDTEPYLNFILNGKNIEYLNLISSFEVKQINSKELITLI